MKKLICLCLVLCLSLFIGCGLLRGKDGPTGGGSAAAAGSAARFDEEEGDTLFQYLSAYKQSADLSNLTPRGLPPESPKTGPANDWGGDPVPYVNPLGSQALYDGGVDYNPDGEMHYTYLEDSTETSRTVHGQKWSLGFTPGEGDHEGDPFPFLRDYAAKLGAEFLPAVSEDVMIFIVREQDARHFCTVTATAGGIGLEIIKQRVFEVNKAYTITPDMYDDAGEFHFIADLPGAKFTRIHCGLPDGGLWLLGEGESENSSIRWNCYYITDLYTDQHKQYTLYDFPQDPGLYEFILSAPNDYEVPSTFTIEFRETEYVLPGYKPGGLGALVVKNTPPVNVFVVSQKSITLDDKINGRSCYCDYTPNDYSDIPLYGVPNGDDIWFNLPAGYYTIIEEPGDTRWSRSNAQLIPVSAGEQTTVTLPDSWKAASEALYEGSDDRELTGSIEIGRMTDKAQTAELALSVSDPYDRDVFPTRENTKITEGGKEVKITDIRREIAPCSIALVIDSSGSMEDDMNRCRGPNLACTKGKRSLAKP